MPSGNSPRVVLYDSNGDQPLIGSTALSASIPVVLANDHPTIGVSGTLFTQPVAGVTGSITGSVVIANRVDVSGSAWTPTVTGSVVVANRVDVSGSSWIPTVTGSVTLAAAPLVLQGTNPWVISGSSWVPTVTGSVVVANRVDVTGSNWIPTITGSVQVLNRVDVTGSNWVQVMTGSMVVANRVDVSGTNWIPTVTGSVVVANQVNVTGSGWTPTITGSVQVLNVVNVTGSNWTQTITGSVGLTQAVKLVDGGSVFSPLHSEPTGGRTTILSGAVVTSASGTLLTWQGWSEWYLVVSVKGPVSGTNPVLNVFVDQIEPVDQTSVLVDSESATGLLTVSGSCTGTTNFNLQVTDSVSDTFRIRWTVAGTNPVFSGTSISWIGHAAGNAIEGQADVGSSVHDAPIVVAGVDSNTKVAYIHVDSSGNLVTTDVNAAANATFGFSYGTISTGATTNVPIRNTTYTEQTASFTRSVASANANDTSAGTGAQQVTITYYSYDFSGPFTETVTLNGTTGVSTVNTNICFIEKIVVSRVGSGGVTAGIISLYQSVNKTGGVIGTIAAGDNQTFWAHHYVPSGKTTYITGYTGNNNSSSNLTLFSIQGQASGSTSPSLVVSDTTPGGGGGASVPRTFSSPVTFAGPGRLILYGAPAGSPTIISRGSFDFYEK